MACAKSIFLSWVAKVSCPNCCPDGVNLMRAKQKSWRHVLVYRLHYFCKNKPTPMGGLRVSYCNSFSTLIAIFRFANTPS